MPLFLSAPTINEFYNGSPFGSDRAVGVFGALSPLGKSIQKSYRFLVTFFPNILLANKRPEVFKEIGPMPIIRAFHATAISIPSYAFTKETQMYGTAPRSFPVLKHDGFEVKIDFEEDEKGTIGYFISWLSRLAIEPTLGVHTPPDFVKLPMIGVVTETDNGLPICAYTLHDAFYLNASSLELDHSSGTSVKYSITFNVDIINSFFPQAKLFNSISGRILNGIL